MTHNSFRLHALDKAWCPCSFFFFTPGCTCIILICLVTCCYTIAHSLLACSSTHPSFITWCLLHMLHTISVFSELPLKPVFSISMSAFLELITTELSVAMGSPLPACALSLIAPCLHASAPILCLPLSRPLPSYQDCISLHDIAVLEP